LGAPEDHQGAQGDPAHGGLGDATQFKRLCRSELQVDHRMLLLCRRIYPCQHFSLTNQPCGSAFVTPLRLCCVRVKMKPNGIPDRRTPARRRCIVSNARSEPRIRLWEAGGPSRLIARRSALPCSRARRRSSSSIPLEVTVVIMPHWWACSSSSG